ncbi:MAG: TonB-dependent siderophore receptor [Acidobacteriota bacterium]|nr:TonB-dependent siderophore receptor [Acidobacteriota bacterium]
MTSHHAENVRIYEAASDGLRKGARLFVINLVLLAVTLLVGMNAGAQQKPAETTQQPVKPVTTTVVVRGEVTNNYLANPKTSVTLGGTSLQETPLSVTSVSSAVLEDQGARVLSDVVKNDASVGEDYAPVGYYGDYQIRGFPIDLATGLQIDGMSIAGEQDVPLENKDRVEILKGVAGLESGVASSGGVFNFVTKEPVTDMRPVIDMATDHRGSAYGAVDLNKIFSGTYSPGLRLNLAGERIATYVQHASGWRGMGAADGNFHFGQSTALYTDFEYQHKVQRSEAGYQLLGGTTIPDPVYPSTMLGFQDWSKPNTFDTFNAGSRLEHTFNAKWSGKIAGEYSHSLIDDNVIWPYGPALDADGNSLCPDSPYYFFCPDGSYEIYDYRSPGEKWINASGEGLVKGHFSTGPITHDLIAGGELFHRTVDLSPSVVYALIGVENLFQPNIAYAPESPYQHAGPATLADFNHQTSAIVQERATLPGRIALQAGGRYVRVTDFNYAGERSLWLPQYAMTFSPRSDVTLYGNYGVLMSLGPQAPWWVDNSALFLQPYFTRQTEVGIKYERTILLTAALFRMRQPFFYPKVIDAPDSFCTADEFSGPGDLCFEADGHETHTGLEVSAQGKAASWLQLTASMAAIQAKSNDTGTAAFNDKQVLNVPHVRATLFADVLLPHFYGLHLMPGWSYTGRKAATMDDAVNVDGYNLFNLGARYTPGGENGHWTLRLYADNVLNKRYWKDTGASYGDMFLHQGAPTTVRLSAQYTF